jgi:RHS repeat-associated protein
LQLFYSPNNELIESITIKDEGLKVVKTVMHYFYDAFGRRIGKSSSTQKSSKLNQRGQLVRFPSNLSSLNTTDRPQRKNTLMLWDGNRQIQEYTDDQIFTTVYEQGSFEPVARIVQLASHIEQKRLTDIAYETRRFVRIGESEETINERIADKSQPLISIYHYHCNHLGTPQELTNQDGDVIWLSYDRAWGGSFETIYKPQFIDNWAINESELQPFKFQGQSLDIETGLHYNRFRYYDSDVGMFISRDPIGLLGGSNVFQYAPNPVMWIDPWGLKSANGRTHITYEGVKDGKPYIGYASMDGVNRTAEEVLKYRYPNFDNFDIEPKPVYIGTDQKGKDIARGLEQRLFENRGGLNGTSNKQNPVGQKNSRRDIYLQEADDYMKKNPCVK